MDYNFDWNPAKEKQNIRKHQLNFRWASTVFRDRSQLTIYDEEHSQDEDR
ncbi:BrnT family toxin [Microcoleus sp. K1-B1]